MLVPTDIKYRWVDAYFPFTHPSWELEIDVQGDWMEVLGCGIVEQRLLDNGKGLFRYIIELYYTLYSYMVIYISS